MERMITLVIDSSYLCYQARFTMGAMSYQDTATGVIFGFLSRILHLGMKFQSNDCVFCWDSRSSYRKKKYPWYKEHRHTQERTPEEIEDIKLMHQQMYKLRMEILPTIGFNNNLQQKGIESDDLIAETVKGKGEFLIVSGDSDLLQLLNGNVSMYTPTKKVFWTKQKFIEEYSISPREWVLVKAVGGCRSDGVPPCAPGIGEKTAVKYIAGTLNPTSKAYKKIVETRLTAIARIEAVALPHPRTHPVTLKRNKLRIEALRHVAERYGMNSFAKDSNWSQLISFGKKTYFQELSSRKTFIRKPVKKHFLHFKGVE